MSSCAWHNSALLAERQQRIMPWARRSLRGTTVFARTRDDGKLDLGPDGRVDIKYKSDADAKVYRASARNLGAIAEPGDADAERAPAASAARASPAPRTASATSAPRVTPAPPMPATATGKARPAAATRAIIVYTDGACTGNPGPMGIGAVILRGTERLEIGEHIGQGTNNIAELTAIERALEALDGEHEQPVLVHSDSAYAIGVLSGAYKAKKNVELIARIRERVRRFPHLRFVKVEGHAGVPENERCDQLATQAIARRTGRR